ncbi:MAG: ATP-dependent RNA helicase [Candidatus Eremiobacteraeota bacterium]|nr:ATP-dependent RNA helicase [Candidatus Eremiobacteraeota bacterium]MCW5872225.1 ATP-dependent RNA helicase [Candidatus Eremiobacteraeota bacterium]
MQQAVPDLPVNAVLDTLLQALAREPLVVLEAPPGTGKTTRLPPACLEHFGGQIWVLEPRRLAARYSARRVSELLGEPLGETVGYQVRLDSRVSGKTRLIYMTQGVFARRLIDNPGLRGVDLVILDEFHERSLDNDLALAWLRSQTRCKVLIMSATLPPDLAQQLGKVPLVRCQTPLFPVAIGYEPQGTLSQLLPQTQGSGLVFLPGMGEIRRQAEGIAAAATRCKARLQILHGSLAPAEQDQVLGADPAEKRWVLTTNVAETSLTVPGVHWVVDSGLARSLVQPPRASLSRLETRRISQFAAAQRCGRAGRLGPGQCLRLYSQRDFAARPAMETPEILRSDLSGLVLFWLQLGRPELAWLDTPPEAAWEAALGLLQQLGACRGQGLSELGQAMAQLPLEPRLARFLLACPGPQGARAAAWLGRGGDSQRPDLDQYLHSQAPSLPEERQLRVCDRFAVADLDSALLAAFPDRVGQVRRQQDLVLCDGSGYRLQQPMPNNPWLLALQLELDGDKRVRLMAYQTLEPESLLDRPEFREVRVLEWNDSAGRVEEQNQLRYGELVLEQSRRRARPGAEAAAVLRKHVLESGWWRDQQAQFARWQVRHHWARTADANLFPLPGMEAWLDEVCLKATSLDDLKGQRWGDCVPAHLRRRLIELCPEYVQLGRRRAEVHYEEGQKPWIASKLVDFFGLAQGPQLASGRIPLVLQLLAPNFRPVQITEDLAGFWQRHYPKVRQELCRRYPRHPWPENPLAPQAEELKPKRRT